jgi:hypothetical protein
VVQYVNTQLCMMCSSHAGWYAYVFFAASVLALRVFLCWVHAVQRLARAAHVATVVYHVLARGFISSCLLLGWGRG